MTAAKRISRAFGSWRLAVEEHEDYPSMKGKSKKLIVRRARLLGRALLLEAVEDED